MDDVPQNLIALEAVLERLGHRLVRAVTGEEALKKAAAEPFAVILMDVQMPGLDGFETAHRLKQQTHTRLIPIIFLTANSHEASAVFRGYEQGAVDYLVKPLDADVLRAKVSVFVELFLAREEVQRQGALLRDLALAEQQRLSEASYQALAEAMPQIVWTATPEGVVNYCNRRWFEYVGPGHEPTDWSPFVHSEDLKHAASLWGERGSAGETYEVPVRLRRASDGRFRWHLARAVPQCDASGAIVKWVGTATDIEDHKRREQRVSFIADASRALASSLEPHESLAQLARKLVPELADACAVTLFKDGRPERAIFAHADSRIQALADELRARHHDADVGGLGVCHLAVSGETHAAFCASDLASLRSTLSPAQAELLELLQVQAFICTPVAIGGNVIGAFSLALCGSKRVYDSEDTKQAQELADRVAVTLENARLYSEARQAVAARDDFLSMASHELKTPLTALLLLIQSLLRAAKADAVIPGKHTERLSKASDAANRLERLINQMLDVSRISGARLKLESEDIELGSLVEEVAERFREAAASVGTTIRVERDGQILGTWDASRIDQVITNLVANAVKYGRGRPVELFVSRTPDAAILRVVDHGIGIEPAKQAKIFERFERATTTRDFGGLGLGLWIAKRIVDASGGTISVSSSPDRGAEFVVQLPLRGTR